MKINNEKLISETGLSFESFSDLLYYADSHLEYLITHKENYTKEQERRIADMYHIIQAIDMWNDDEEC